MKLFASSVLVLASLVTAAQADSKLHVSTDIVTWDKPVTEAQCIDKAKAAIAAADPKLTTFTASHAIAGTKTDWVVGIDCLQAYKLNGAYITVADNGSADDHKKVSAALSKALGGKSEMFK